jgi:uncharacterized membrane protein
LPPVMAGVSFKIHNQMKLIEKLAVPLALFLIFVIGIVYILNFINGEISVQTSQWGAFGDYFGGILNPLLSFIVICLLLVDLKNSRSELALTRKEMEKSSEAQQKSQEALNRQIELLMPRPQMVYYVAYHNGMVHGIVENIGTGVAYEINVTIEFSEPEKSGFLESNTLEYEYVAPGQKLGFKLGHISISNKPINFSPHVVTFRYSSDLNKFFKINSTYTVSKSMITGILRTGSLHEITKAIENIK